MKTKLMILMVALAALAGCGNDQAGIQGSGFVEATTVLVSAEVDGVLDALYVDEGDRLARGAPLGVIDTATVVLELASTKAALASSKAAARVAKIDIDRAREDETFARREYNRIDALRKKGSATDQQYDQAQNRLRQSELSSQLAQATLGVREAEVARIESQIGLLQNRLEKCRPLSPVSGLVTSKFTEAGELLAPGRAIVEIARTDSMWVKVYVPAHALTGIHVGDAATVDPEDGRTGPLQGRVVWIADEAEFTPKNVQTEKARADLVYAVKVNMANDAGALKIGMPALVRFK